MWALVCRRARRVICWLRQQGTRHRFEVRSTGDQGWGVFALEDLHRGTITFEYVGVHLARHEVRPCMRCGTVLAVVREVSWSRERQGQGLPGGPRNVRCLAPASARSTPYPLAR